MKENKGITLIALVVTIIVLMILAGVSISVLQGNNGIIKQAQNAKTETKKSDEKDSIDLAIVASIGENKYGVIEQATFQEQLEKSMGGADKFQMVYETTSKKFKITITESKNVYYVDGDGNISE